MPPEFNNFLEYWNYYIQKYQGFNITDKGTTHDYINSYYANEFSNREANIKLVEIGIGDGYSMVLWREWFKNAEIFAIEKHPYHYNHKVPFRIKGVTSIFDDAYIQSTIDVFENNSIDYLIDDGPHTYESQEYCIIYWLSKIKPGGKIIIEDIQQFEHLENFKKTIKNKNLNVSTKVFDSRESKGRYDDIIFEITKL
jgi:hypothetical protein